MLAGKLLARQRRVYDEIGRLSDESDRLDRQITSLEEKHLNSKKAVEWCRPGLLPWRSGGAALEDKVAAASRRVDELERALRDARAQRDDLQKKARHCRAHGDLATWKQWVRSALLREAKALSDKKRSRERLRALISAKAAELGDHALQAFQDEEVAQAQAVSLRNG